MTQSGIVAITGATGFIGRHLVRRLVADRVPVRVLTRNIFKARQLLGDAAEYVEADLGDARQLTRLVEGADCVYHCASELKDVALMRATNVLGTQNILKALHPVGPRSFVYLSSAGVIGQGRYRVIDEQTPCRPGNAYEQTKWEAEQMVREFAEHSTVAVSILRPTNVVGEDKDTPADSFYQLIRQIKQRRFFHIAHGQGAANYVYVGDVVHALIALSRSAGPQAGVYLINDLSSMKDIVDHIRTCLRLKGRLMSVPYVPVLAASAVIHAVYPGFILSPSRVRALYSPYQFSSHKIITQLGYTYEFGIKKGLELTIRWLEDKQWL